MIISLNSYLKHWIELEGALEKNKTEKEKSGKLVDQSSNGNTRKRKNIGGQSSKKSGKGIFSEQKPP